MLVRLTRHDKNEIWLEHTCIWCVTKDVNNPLVTILLTTMIGPKGPMLYQVMETPTEVAEAVRLVSAGKSQLIFNQ